MMLRLTSALFALLALPLSAAEIPLDESAFGQETPVAISTAEQALVVWRDGIDRVLAKRVARDGSVRDAQPIVISPVSCVDNFPGAGTDGRDFLVAWHEADGMRIARVLADGTAMPPVRISVRDSCVSFFYGGPLVVSNGTDYLVVWANPRQQTVDMVGVRVRGDGTPIDAVPLVLRAGIGRGPIGQARGASNGTDYLVAWNAQFVRLTAGGENLEPITRFFTGGHTAAVWWNGVTYSVLHSDKNLLKISRITADGRILPGITSILAPTEVWAVTQQPACDGRGCSVPFGTFEEGRTVLRDLRAEDDGVTASLRIGEAVAVAAPPRASPNEIWPLAAFRIGGGRLFVVHSDGGARMLLRVMEGPTRRRSVRH